MNYSPKSPLSIEEISKLIWDAKFQNPPAHEKFDIELFILGYLSALQTLNTINRIPVNLEGLIALRNLEANGKIATQEKFDLFQGILKLAESSLNVSQLSSFQIFPEKWNKLDQSFPKGRKEDRESFSPGASNKRSKSIESQQNVILEKGKVVCEQGACSLCTEKVKAINQTKIPSCGHILHDNCLKTYLYQQVNQRIYPIFCPMSNCKKEIAPNILQTKLDAESTKRFWNYAFMNNIQKPDNNYSWCPTQGCHYFYLTPNPMIMMFRCPLCQKHYCLNCKTEYHRGQSCDAYKKVNNIQSSKLQDELVRFKQCPKCAKWVEYNNNCQLKCTCSNTFCINCNSNQQKCGCRDKGCFSNTTYDNLSEETFLYKMIMQDQAHENALLTGDYFYGENPYIGNKKSEMGFKAGGENPFAERK